MKIAFIIPVLDEVNLQRTFNRINEACDVDFDIYFAINGKLNSFFTNVRSTYLNESRVKAFMADRPVNEHKLITLGMEMTEDYDATIIYSGKEDVNTDVMKAFIASWKAGNKIVYLKKQFYGPRNLWINFKRGLYSMGIKMLGIFQDRSAETDIQLLDQDVVKTINQLPQKNRQLRVLDSFVGFPIDVIQLEIDNKEKENKLYIEKNKSYKLCKISAIACALLSVICLALPIVSILLEWNLPALLYIFLFALGGCTLVLSYVFTIKKTLNLRVGEPNEISELNDLRNKIEKYNITNKK